MKLNRGKVQWMSGVLGFAVLLSCYGIASSEPAAKAKPEKAACCGGAESADGPLMSPTDRYYEISIVDGKPEIKERESAPDAAEFRIHAGASIGIESDLFAELQPECTSAGTAHTGERKSCSSGWSIVTLPAGYVFIKDRVEKTCRSCAGSENDINVEFDNFVEVIPGTGIEQPRTMRASVHARSPRSCGGCRGWTKATVKCKYVKYQVD